MSGAGDGRAGFAWGKKFSGSENTGSLRWLATLRLGQSRSTFAVL
jgi:hypothetical protein